MFYPAITLRKDGAFMLCEDASEFDTNYDTPTPPEPVVKAELIVIREVDPLDKFADKMKVLYDQIVNPMLSEDFSFDNAQQAIDSCEKLASDTSTIFNTMRIKLTKLAGIVCGGLTETMAKESFQAHAGTFMKNAALVKQQGIESYPVHWKENPTFSNAWGIENLISVIASKPEVLAYMIYEPELNALLGDMNTFRNFNGFVDMMQCVFDDRARLDRLSADSGTNLTFRGLLGDGSGPTVVGGDNSYQAKTNQTMIVQYLNMLSKVLREVCQTTYDLQINLVDNTVDAEMYEARLRPLVYKVINLFGVGVALGCYFATCLRRAIAIQKGCEAYTKLLLDTIKDYGGKE